MSSILENEIEGSWVLYRPHPIAEASGLPLHVARTWVDQNTIPSFRGVDGRTYVEYNDVMNVTIAYLNTLPLDPIFDTCGFRQGIPILPAWEDLDGYLHMYCRWCRAFHHHGQGDGSRIPHCETNTPWREIGCYVLQVRGEWDAGIRKRVPEVRYPRIIPSVLDLDTSIPDPAPESTPLETITG